jgi:hypothetical protein
MKAEPLEVIRGSGNVYRDLGQEDADAKQLKALLAAEIIKTLNQEGMTGRTAQARTGILQRLTSPVSVMRILDASRSDRLVGIINRLASNQTKGPACCAARQAPLA